MHAWFITSAFQLLISCGLRAARAQPGAPAQPLYLPSPPVRAASPAARRPFAQALNACGLRILSQPSRLPRRTSAPPPEPAKHTPRHASSSNYFGVCACRRFDRIHGFFSNSCVSSC